MWYSLCDKVNSRHGIAPKLSHFHNTAHIMTANLLPQAEQICYLWHIGSHFCQLISWYLWHAWLEHRLLFCMHDNLILHFLVKQIQNGPLLIISIWGSIPGGANVIYSKLDDQTHRSLHSPRRKPWNLYLTRYNCGSWCLWDHESYLHQKKEKKRKKQKPNRNSVVFYAQQGGGSLGIWVPNRRKTWRNWGFKPVKQWFTEIWKKNGLFESKKLNSSQKVRKLFLLDCVGKCVGFCKLSVISLESSCVYLSNDISSITIGYFRVKIRHFEYG